MLKAKRKNETNQSNNNKDMINYKGYFIENEVKEEKKFYEHGAHFSYKELYAVLLNIKLKKEKSENIVKVRPKKKINFERNNSKTKNKNKEANINDIINSMKTKIRSRNVGQDNKVINNKNLNQLTFIPLNYIENKIKTNTKTKENNKFKSINDNNYINNKEQNQILNDIDNRLRQLKYKYNPTRNKEQKYSFDNLFFLTNENQSNNNINKINDINSNLNIYKSYQTNYNLKNNIKLNDGISFNNKKFKNNSQIPQMNSAYNNNIIKKNLLNEKINNKINRRIYSSNLGQNSNNYQFKKLKIYPLIKNKTKAIPIPDIKYNNNFKNILKSNNYYHENQNNFYKKKSNLNDRNIFFHINKINSFSADTKKNYLFNDNLMNKLTKNKIELIRKPHMHNISNISNNSNFSKQRINQRKKYINNENISINFNKESSLLNFNNPKENNIINNLYKLLNTKEKISRNRNDNYFFNNATSINNYTNKNLNLTNQIEQNHMNTNNTFYHLNNMDKILINKRKNRIKLNNNNLSNSRNFIFKTKKYFNTSYINNTNISNNMTNFNITNNNLENNNYNNEKFIENIPKRKKKNDVNINININNINKIIYDRTYKYKTPLMNKCSKIKKYPIQSKNNNYIHNKTDGKIFKNMENNNNLNYKKIKFINIQFPKKKFLNIYNISNNNI